MDKLSIKQIEEFLADPKVGGGQWHYITSVCRQLLDTMRENERLKALLYEIGKPIKAQVHPNPSKDSVK